MRVPVRPTGMQCFTGIAIIPLLAVCPSHGRIKASDNTFDEPKYFVLLDLPFSIMRPECLSLNG